MSMFVEQVVWVVHIGNYKKEIQKELKILNDNQKKFVMEYFKESYEVLNIKILRREKRNEKQKNNI